MEKHLPPQPSEYQTEPAPTVEAAPTAKAAKRRHVETDDERCQRLGYSPTAMALRQRLSRDARAHMDMRQQEKLKEQAQTSASPFTQLQCDAIAQFTSIYLTQRLQVVQDQLRREFKDKLGDWFEEAMGAAGECVGTTQRELRDQIHTALEKIRADIKILQNENAHLRAQLEQHDRHFATDFNFNEARAAVTRN